MAWPLIILFGAMFWRGFADDLCFPDAGATASGRGEKSVVTWASLCPPSRWRLSPKQVLKRSAELTGHSYGRASFALIFSLLGNNEARCQLWLQKAPSFRLVCFLSCILS